MGGPKAPLSPQESVTAMRRLIDDRELRERLGRAAQARADLFAASAVVPRFEALYDQLAQSSTHTAAQPLVDIPAARDWLPQDGRPAR